ncbi:MULTISPECIES: hypothetical protein [unclassified Enterobacter]|jgi:hypothetical protein|uniref:hypothetical protein n=1 Tax=unclassified Enterobacter TaxID=2608935 RepID=UPI0015C86A8B|nr:MULTISPECIES: hypothetical protein [unclassified Enterobacter]MBB3303953.1 hypothetical protein [Enterobacter sp. Sphag1F]NYI12942.1 hypothetical protein [Enterobacter sp. Sphag71]
MKFLIILVVVIISGCSSASPEVLPEVMKLSNATLKVKYHNEIEIKGGPVNKTSVSVIITPSNSGLMWKPKTTMYVFAGEEKMNEDYHKIIIYGTPSKVGDFDVIVSGHTLGTMYSGIGFYRKYRLVIND